MSHWIGLKTLILRECGVIFRFWSFTLAPPVIMTILYFTLFGEIIGKRVGTVDGVDYIRYLAPGLVVLWAVPYAFGHTAAGFLGARFFKYIDELTVSPLPGWIVMAGYVIGGAIRGLLVGLIALVVTALFTHLHVYSITESVVVVCLAALVAALGGFITALLANGFEQVTTIQALILTPLLYLGGVFNPIATLPHLAQQLSLANPMFYLVNAIRWSFLGRSDVSFPVALAILCACGLILFVVALKLMTHGLGIRESP
jgi:ABC-2 type transport system permease protein